MRKIPSNKPIPHLVWFVLYLVLLLNGLISVMLNACYKVKSRGPMGVSQYDIIAFTFCFNSLQLSPQIVWLKMASFADFMMSLYRMRTRCV